VALEHAAVSEAQHVDLTWRIGRVIVGHRRERIGILNLLRETAHDRIESAGGDLVVRQAGHVDEVAIRTDDAPVQVDDQEGVVGCIEGCLEQGGGLFERRPVHEGIHAQYDIRCNLLLANTLPCVANLLAVASRAGRAEVSCAWGRL